MSPGKDISNVCIFQEYHPFNIFSRIFIKPSFFSGDFEKNPLEEMTKLCKLRRKIDTHIEPLAFPAKDFYEHTKAEFVSEILEKGKIIYKDGKILI